MSNEPESISVLLVEDNEIDVEITRRVLAKSGAAIVLDVARDGSEALALLSRSRTQRDREAQPPLPSLVLLDLRLPLMDGRELLRRIKNDTELCAIPVAVLTGATGEKPMLECMELGSNMYFVKPMTVSDAATLIPTIRKYWAVIEQLRSRRAA